MEDDQHRDQRPSRPDPDPQPDGDPRHEPENSTVDDWFGQSVARDAELADELVDAMGGDRDEAERRFDEQATGEHEQAERHAGRLPGGEPVPRNV